MANKTYQSDIIQNNSPGRFGVYPQNVYGSCLIPINTTLATTDVIQLCIIPANTILVPSSCFIALPDLDSGAALTLNLEDDASTPNVYVSATTKGQAAAIITAADFAQGVAIATTYTTQQILRLVPAHIAGGAMAAAGTIYFGFEFAPL